MSQRVRYCPCGRPLVQKPKESNSAFEERLYCNPTHKGKYHKTVRGSNFGLNGSKSKSPHKTGPGILGYLYGRPSR